MAAAIWNGPITECALAAMRMVLRRPNVSMAPLLLIVACGISAAPASAQVEDLLDSIGVGRESSLSEGKVGAGLKEALRVATEKSVNLTGRPDGYFSNAAIKILMPEKLRTVERGLRMVGYGEQVDAFVLSMNRAAEQSAPAAERIFIDAITGMSFGDAKKILTGGDTAATEFFKSKTTDKLAAAFKPIVHRNMSEVGVTRQYQALMSRFSEIPLAKSFTFDIDEYVVNEALDGLFHVVSEQEKLIRKNPAARTTELLREVFSRK